MVIILMGPSGCGKTTVGLELQKILGWSFYDADDYHPKENVAKMNSGVPLTDADRKPWLEALAAEIRIWNSGENAILACSALKETYRQMLGVDQKTILTAFLKGDFTLLAERLKNRKGHYMDPNLLQSQIDTLEEPQDGLIVEIDSSPTQIANQISRSLKLLSATKSH
jgi:carbohydrate kinase (thermoresistant glucokinase family)